MGGDFYLTTLATSTTLYFTFPHIVEGEDRFLRSGPFTAYSQQGGPVLAHRPGFRLHPSHYVLAYELLLLVLPRLYFRDIGNVQHEPIAFFGNKSRLSGILQSPHQRFS
jgi:hypothetical protein